MRNCRKIVFLECNKTPENIFQNNFHNVAKDLEIFSFLKNILHSENILHVAKRNLNMYELPLE